MGARLACSRPWVKWPLPIGSKAYEPPSTRTLTMSYLGGGDRSVEQVEFVSGDGDGLCCGEPFDELVSSVGLVVGDDPSPPSKSEYRFYQPQ